VSIGLPVYNGADYLEEAISSILAQTFADFELIISDNASTDGTRDICERYAKQDARVRYYRAPVNWGATWNYNRTFALTAGEYFRWAAHDDVVEPEYLEACVGELDRHPKAVLSYPSTIIIDSDGNHRQKYPDNLDLRSSDPCDRWEKYLQRYYPNLNECNAVFGLIRRGVLGQTPLIESYASSDMILLGHLALHGEIHELGQPLFLRRDHSDTSIRTNPKAQERVTWFDPKKSGKFSMPRWQWFVGHLRAVSRAPISVSEKMRCLSLLREHFLANNFRVMLREVGGVVRRAVLSAT